MREWRNRQVRAILAEAREAIKEREEARKQKPRNPEVDAAIFKANLELKHRPRMS